MEDGTSSALGSEKVTEEWIPVCRMTRDVLDRIGDKWSLLVINLLDGRTRRFMDIRRAIPGISQRMLTVTLRHLERSGGLMFTDIDDTHARRVPASAISPWAFPGKCRLRAARAHDPPRRSHGALGINAVIDSPEQIIDFVRANLGFCVIERNGATKAVLRMFQPSPRLLDVAENVCRMIKQPRKSQKLVGFIGRQTASVLSSLQC